MPEIHFVETASFSDFVRYVCAFREYPLRVYSSKLNGKLVLSSRRILSNSLFSFYVPTPKTGKYISYYEEKGKERFSVINSTKAYAKYAPIINLVSIPSNFTINPKRIKDKFIPIEIADLDSLARLTYDPELPDEPDMTLFLFPHKKKWVIGYITSIDFDDVVYFFNYVKLDKEPTKPFLQYSLQNDRDSIFTDSFQHDYRYLPVIKLKRRHKIFGLS